MRKTTLVLVAGLVAVGVVGPAHGAGPGALPPAAGQLAESYMLTLGEQRFDPLAGVPAAPAKLAATRTSDPDLHLVQFDGPPQNAWLADLRARGLQVVQYIHPYTYVVWGAAAALPDGGRAANVRWSGAFQPAYRLLPRHRNLTDEIQAVRVLVVRAANTDAIVRALATHGAKPRGRQVVNERLEIVTVDVAGSQLATLAALPGVYSVQPVPLDGGSRGEMGAQACAGNLDSEGFIVPGYSDWLAGRGLSGAGVIIASVDEGIQDNHPDLENRLIACIGTTCGGTTTSSHGTHTAGLIAADGSSGVMDSGGFLRGLGIAPGVSLVEQIYPPFYRQPGGMRLLMQDSHSNGAVASSNSWGPSGTPRGYDADTMAVDAGVRDADPDTPGNQPLAYVLSIMNGHGGTSTQGTPDEAKNILTVGATALQTALGAQVPDINSLSSNTAHGPALDGRTIPHLVAPGCYVDSTNWPTSHGLKCGTSMSAPHVAGALALFVEYYRQLPGYVDDPSPALIKAALLPVALSLAGHLDADGGVLGHPFDSKQGWGRLDVAAVIDPPLTVQYFDNPCIFTSSGQEWAQVITAADPTQPLRLMLVWTDAPGHGLGGSTPAWNNDLDLVVEAETDVYVGNHFDADGWSAPGGSPDYRNNTEGVFIGPTAPDTYTVRVVASNINSDGVPGNGDETDQDFALVCYNCVLQPGFLVLVDPGAQAVCTPDPAVYDVVVEDVLGFDEPVTLALAGDLASMTATFTPNPVLPPGTSTLTLSDTATAPPGWYDLEIQATAGDMARHAPLRLRLFDDVPGPVVPESPADGATDVDLWPVLIWQADAEAQEYTLELAAEPGLVEPLVSVAGLPGTSYAPAIGLAPETTYYWRVWATNACGDGAHAPVFAFTTRAVPTLLLVDDDDNQPDVRSYYTDALDALGVAYDVWDTEHSDNEPSADFLANYETVVWFTGDAYGGTAGPGAAGEAALIAFLNTGKNLMISSQDYYYDRGLTTLMVDYLGVATVTNDVAQTVVTGAGSALTGLGPYVLSYPFSNFSDAVYPNNSAATAFMGDKGSAAVSVDSPIFRTVYLGFPFEALPGAAEREAVLAAMLAWFRPFIDCNDNGIADHADIALGTSLDEDGDGIPDECQVPLLGDMNCDGTVDRFDIEPFVQALVNPQLYLSLYPDCDINNADVNADGLLNVFDIDPFILLLEGN